MSGAASDGCFGQGRRAAWTDRPRAANGMGEVVGAQLRAAPPSNKKQRKMPPPTSDLEKQEAEEDGVPLELVRHDLSLELPQNRFWRR